MSKFDSKGFPIIGQPNRTQIYDMSNGDFDPLNDTNIPGISEDFRKACGKGFVIRPVVADDTLNCVSFGNYYNDPDRTVGDFTIDDSLAVAKEYSYVKWEETRMIKILASGSSAVTVEIGVQ